MTTIAWDGKTLAADRRETLGSNGTQTTKKIFDLAGKLFGASGDTASAVAMRNWVHKGCRVEDFPASQSGETWSRVLVVDRIGGTLYVYEQAPWPIKIQKAYYATGSGCEYALGAMAAGATAKEAVRIASLFDPQTGDGIDVLEA